MRGLAGASIASLFGILICGLPLLVAVRFALSPSERLLSLMRPLTLGAVFAALSGFALAIANGFSAVSTMQALDLQSTRIVGAVFMEGVAPVVASLACLAVAWLVVAIGVRRS